MNVISPCAAFGESHFFLKICFEDHKGLTATISNMLSGYCHSEKDNSTEDVEFYKINDRENHFHVYNVGNGLNKVTNAS